MKLDSSTLQSLISLLTDNNLLSAEEIQYVTAVAKEDFPFAKQMEIAETVHYHIHTNNVETLPHQLFLDNNAVVANKAEGYIKYAFKDGINLIFSHIPVAHKEQTDHMPGETYLDHIGIDIRSDDKKAYIIFQQIPFVSAQHDYLFTRQGDGKESVKCCHIQVKEKYWVYPDEHINYEFAFGPLVVHGSGFGIDLRPANLFKAKPSVEAESCCSPATPKLSIFINS